MVDARAAASRHHHHVIIITSSALRRITLTANHLQQTSHCHTAAGTAASDGSGSLIDGNAASEAPPGPIIFDKELPGCRDVALSQDEIAHFKACGWIVKKRLIDPNDLAPIRDCIWPAAAELGLPFKKDDPTTFTLPKDHGFFPPTEPKHTFNDGVGIDNFFGGGSGGWTWRHYTPCAEDWFLERTARHPRVREVAAQFLGPLRPSYRCRGLYAVLPQLVEDHASAPVDGSGLSPHTDGVASGLNCMIYADDCAPGGGGFTLWPDSHRQCYYHMETEINMEPLDGYAGLLASIKANVVPVEIPGEAGDVVFWHPRSVHSAGVNTSDRIRVVIPCDFQKDVPTIDFPPYSGISRRRAESTGKSLDPVASGQPGELTMQWWIDTKEAIAPDLPPQDDMFSSWEI